VNQPINADINGMRYNIIEMLL